MAAPGSIAAVGRRHTYFPRAYLYTDRRIAESIGEEFLRTHKLAPLSSDEDSCILAVVNPGDNRAIDQFRVSVGRTVSIVVSTGSEVDLALDTLFRPGDFADSFWRQFAETLFHVGFASNAQLSRALRQRSQDRRPLDDILVESDALDEESIAEAKGFMLSLPWIRLDSYRTPAALVPVIPRDLAQRLAVVPMLRDGGTLVVAGPNPLDRPALNELADATGFAPRQVICTRAGFKQAFQQAYGQPDGKREKPAMPFERALLKRGLVSEEQLRTAQMIHGKTREPVEDVLLRIGYLSMDRLVEARAMELGVQSVRLTVTTFQEDLSRLIPEVLSQRYRCLPFAVKKNTLSLAMADPLDTEAKLLVSELTGMTVTPYLCPEENINNARPLVYGHSRRAVIHESGALRSRVPPPQKARSGSHGRSDQLQAGAAPEAPMPPSIHLERYMLRPDVAKLIPEDIARQHCLVAIHKQDHVLSIAVADPLDSEGIAAVEQATGLAVKVAVATKPAIIHAIEEQYIAESSEETAATKEFANYLLAQGVLDQDQLTDAWRRCIAGHVSLDIAVTELGFVSQEEIALAMAQFQHLDYVDISPYIQTSRVMDAIGQSVETKQWYDPVQVDAAHLIAEDVASELCVLPIATSGEGVIVAFAHPLDAEATSRIQKLISHPVVAVVATREQIADAIRRTIGRKTLGDFLVEAGTITPRQLKEALQLHRTSGSRIGKSLISLGYVTDTAIATLMAEQQDIAFFDLSSVIIDDEVVRALPEELEREFRLIPVDIDETDITVAMVDPLDTLAIQRVEEASNRRIHRVLTTDESFEQAMEEIYRADYLEKSAQQLVFRYPDESAFQVLNGPQKVFMLSMVGLSAVLVTWNYMMYFLALNVLATMYYLGSSVYKLYLIYKSLTHTLEVSVSDEELAGLDERDLPVYTILVPLYKEVDVISRLVGAIDKLDYPKPKLDVKILLEEDDKETIATLRALNLPAHFKLVIVPDAKPKGKPKACNYGLIHAEGKYVVIFDAEDIPEPDQLKKAVVAFNKADETVACIQAKLNYYNRNQNLLTRWFTAEYSLWFDLFLPGLDADDVPIPLGGTSNHFPTALLQQLGAWDPHNVTEDADLGIRLYKAGLKTAVIDSTTYEEANSQVYNWIRQRSRWVKGYIQTYLVQMRHPIRLWRFIGTRAFFSFNMIIGGTVAAFLLNPIYWVLTALWFITKWALISELYPSVIFYIGSFGLYVGNFIFMYLNVAGCLRRKYYDMVKYALLTPIYWALMSIAAWKGFLQLFYKPSYWEKTTHGLYKGEIVTAPSSSWRELFVSEKKSE